MTRILTAWVDGEVVEIEVEAVEDIIHEPSIEERISILEENKFAKNVNSITLYADAWTGDASPYSQVVDIPGITENSKVDLQPSAEQLTIFYDKDIAFVTENEGGVLTVFCIGQKPANDYTIQTVITEVIYNG